MKKILFIISAVILYILFIRKPVINLYCKHQVENKINNYKRSVKRNAQLMAIEDENYISILKKPMFQQCLQAEGYNILKD